LGNKPKKCDFVHQTVSRWEVHTGWARDYMFIQHMYMSIKGQWVWVHTRTGSTSSSLQVVYCFSPGGAQASHETSVTTALMLAEGVH